MFAQKKLETIYRMEKMLIERLDAAPNSRPRSDTSTTKHLLLFSSRTLKTSNVGIFRIVSKTLTAIGVTIALPCNNAILFKDSGRVTLTMPAKAKMNLIQQSKAPRLQQMRLSKKLTSEDNSRFSLKNQKMLWMAEVIIYEREMSRQQLDL